MATGKAQSNSNEQKNPRDEKGRFSDQQICLAALSAEFLWSEKSTGGQSLIGEYVKLEGDQYIFKSQQGKYRCRLVGNRVIWANYDGRWRDRPDDTYLTFRADGDNLIINARYSDGSSQERLYAKSLLAKHAR